MNFSKSKILLVLIILFFVMIIGMFFMKPNNSYEGFSDDAPIVQQDAPQTLSDESSTVPKPTNSIKKSNKG